MIRFDEAVALIAATARPLGAETVGLDFAEGRVLAEPVIAQVDAPGQDSSAMDGYAVRDSDLVSFPVGLKLVGQSAPGCGFASTTQPGEAVRIFTGAPVPEGTDRVVVQELTHRQGERVVIESRPAVRRHIRFRGSDFEAGDVLLPAGRRLDARGLLAVAAADFDRVAVWRRPRVAVIGTGDELVAPGQSRQRPGSVPESVSYGVAALARVWGADVLERTRLADDLPAMQIEARRRLATADLLVVTGGASVGDRDHSRAMFGPALELIFSKVAIKPGKPVWFGRVGETLTLGLPGNPTSAMVTARLMLAPLLARLTGRDLGEALAWRSGLLAEPLPACGDRETFVTAALDRGRARPLSSQDSSGQRSLAAADVMIRRAPGTVPAPVGAEVDIIDF
jgi:molybdopterin molybdotransferase